MNNLLVLFGSLISATASHFLSPSILPSSSFNETSLSTGNNLTAETKSEKISRKHLMAKARAFSKKIVYSVATNDQVALEVMEKQRESFFDLYKEIELADKKTQKNFFGFSNYLWKIINENLSGEMTCGKDGEGCKVDWKGVEKPDKDEEKLLMALKLNKNILSLAVRGEKAEKNSNWVEDWRNSIVNNERLRALSEKIDRFTWSFAKKIGLSWERTIEESKEYQSKMTKLKDQINVILEDKDFKDERLKGKLKYYLHYLKKILETDLPAIKKEDNVMAMEISRGIQKNLLYMINHWKEFKEVLKNPNESLFAKTASFNKDVGLSAAMNELKLMEEMKKRKEGFENLHKEMEVARGKVKNNKMKRSLGNYSFYLQKILGEDLTEEPVYDDEVKSIKAISLNKNILSLMVYGEKIEKISNWEEDWRKSIKNEGLRKLSEEVDRFTWSFVKKVGLNWEITMKEMKEHESRMVELKGKISSIVSDATHKDKEYAKKLGNYSFYLEKILEQDINAKITRENAPAIIRSAQKNLLYMVDYWKEFKEAVKK